MSLAPDHVRPRLSEARLDHPRVVFRNRRQRVPARPRRGSPVVLPGLWLRGVEHDRSGIAKIAMPRLWSSIQEAPHSEPLDGKQTSCPFIGVAAEEQRSFISADAASLASDRGAGGVAARASPYTPTGDSVVGGNHRQSGGFTHLDGSRQLTVDTDLGRFVPLRRRGSKEFALHPAVVLDVCRVQRGERRIGFSVHRQCPDQLVLLLGVLFRDVHGDTWFWLTSPKNLPAPIVNRLNAELRAMMKRPNIVAYMRQRALLTMDADPGAVAKFVADEFAFWGPIAKNAGLRVQ